MVDTARYKPTDRDVQVVAITTVDPINRKATGITRSRTTITINCAYATGDTITTPAVGEQWYCERFEMEWRLYGRIPFNDATLNIEPEEGQVSVGSARGPLELNGTEVRANAPVFRLNDAYFRDTGETLERSIDKINWEPIAAQAAGILQIVSNAISGQPPTNAAIQDLLDALDAADLNAVNALSDFLDGWNTDGTRSLLSQLTKALTGNWASASGGLVDIATWATNLTSLWDGLCNNTPFLNSLKSFGTGSTPAAQIASGLQAFLNDLYKLLICDFTGNATPQNFKDLLTGLQTVLSNNWIIKGLGDLANNPTGGLLANVFAGLDNLGNNFFIQGLAEISSNYQAGVSNRLTAAVRGLEELFQNIFSALFCDVTGTLTVAQVKTRLNAFFDSLNPANNPLVQALKTYAEAQGNTVGNTLEKVVKGVSAFATAILDALFCTGTTINLSSVSSAVTSIFAAIRNSALVTGLVALFEVGGNATLSTLEKAVRGFFTFYDQIAAALSSLFPSSAPLAIVSAIQAMITAITDNPYIKMLQSVATTTSTNLVQQILSGVTGVLDWFIDVFNNLFPFINWNKIKTLDFAGLMDDMVTFNITGLSQLGTWVTDGVVTPIKNAITGVIDTNLTGSLKAINDFFGNISGGFLAKIVDAMTGNSLGFASGPLGTLATLFNGVSLTGGKSLLTQLGDRINEFGDTLGINSIVASITGADVGDLINSFYLEITGSPTGGNYTLSYGSGNTTGSIAYNASASTIQTALALLTGIGTVTVTPVTSATSTKFSIAIPNTTAYLTLGAFTLSGGTSPAITVTEKFRGGLNALASFFTNFSVFDGVNTLLEQVLEQAGSNIIPLVSALTGLNEAKLTELFGASPINAVTKIFNNLRSLFTFTPPGGTATMTLLTAGDTFTPAEIITAANAVIGNLLSKATAGIIPAAVIDNLSISKILVGADSLVKALTGSTATGPQAITDIGYFFTNLRKFLGIGTGTGLVSFLTDPTTVFSVPTAINNFITNIISQATATFSPARITGLITGLTGSGTAVDADIAKFFTNLRTTLGVSTAQLLPVTGTFTTAERDAAREKIHDVVKAINDGLVDSLKWAKTDVVNAKVAIDTLVKAFLGTSGLTAPATSYLDLAKLDDFLSTLRNVTGADFLAKLLKYLTDQILGTGNAAITTLTNFFSGFNTTGTSVTGSLANQLAVKIGGTGATNLTSIDNLFTHLRKFLGLDALNAAGISVLGGTLSDANFLTHINTFITQTLLATGNNLVKALTGQAIAGATGELENLRRFFTNLKSLFGTVDFLLPTGNGVGGFGVAANLQALANAFISNVLSVATTGTIPAAVLDSLGVNKITGLVAALTGQSTTNSADAITKFFAGFAAPGADAFNPTTGANNLVNQLSKSITGKASGATLADITNFLGIGTNNLAAFTGTNSLISQIALKIGGNNATSLAALGDFFTNVRKFFGLDLPGAPNFFATTDFNLATAVDWFISNVLRATAVSTKLVTFVANTSQIAVDAIPDLDINKIFLTLNSNKNSLVKVLTGATTSGAGAMTDLDRFFTNFRALFGPATGTNWLLQATGTGGTAFNATNVANAFITNTLSQASNAITSLIPAHAFANFDVSKVNNLFKALTGQDLTGATLSPELTQIKNFFGGFTGFTGGTTDTLAQQITKAVTGKSAASLDEIAKFLGIGTANGGLLDFSATNTETLVNQIVKRITGTGTTLTQLEDFAKNLKKFLGDTDFLASTAAFTAGLPAVLNTFAKTFISGNTAKLLNSYLIGIAGTPNGGSFRLAYGDQITAPITWTTSPATTATTLAASIQSALRLLTNIGPGGATATVNTTVTAGSIVGINVRIDNLIAPLTLSSNSLTVASGQLPVILVEQQTDPTFIPIMDVSKINNLVKALTGQNIDDVTPGSDLEKVKNFFGGFTGFDGTANTLVQQITKAATGRTGGTLDDIKDFLGLGTAGSTTLFTPYTGAAATTMLSQLVTKITGGTGTLNLNNLGHLFGNLRTLLGFTGLDLHTSTLTGSPLAAAQTAFFDMIKNLNIGAIGNNALITLGNIQSWLGTTPIPAPTVAQINQFFTNFKTFFKGLGSGGGIDFLSSTFSITEAINAFITNILNQATTAKIGKALLDKIDISGITSLANYLTGTTGTIADTEVQRYFTNMRHTLGLPDLLPAGGLTFSNVDAASVAALKTARTALYGIIKTINLDAAVSGAQEFITKTNFTGWLGAANLTEINYFFTNLTKFFKIADFKLDPSTGFDVGTVAGKFIKDVINQATFTSTVGALISQSKIAGGTTGTTLVDDVAARLKSIDLKNWFTTDAVAGSDDIHKMITNLRKIIGIGPTTLLPVLSSGLLSGSALTEVQKLLHGVVTTVNGQLLGTDVAKLATQTATQTLVDAKATLDTLVKQITGKLGPNGVAGTYTSLSDIGTTFTNLRTFLGFNPLDVPDLIVALSTFISKINTTAVTTFLSPTKIQSATAGIANLSTEIISKATIDGIVKAITKGTGNYTDLSRIENFFGGFGAYVDGNPATAFLNQLAKYITGNTYTTIAAAIAGLDTFFNRLRRNLNDVFNFSGLDTFFSRDPDVAGPLKFSTSMLSDLDEWKKFTVVGPLVSQFLGGLKITREQLGLGENEEPGLATLGDIAGRLLTDLTDIPANLLKGLLPPNLLGVIPVSQISNTSPNLLSQGGFEEAVGLAPEAVADGWSWDTTQASFGHSSAAKLTITSAKNRFLYSRQAVPVAKGDRLVVSAAIKTASLTPTGSTPISIALIPFAGSTQKTDGLGNPISITIGNAVGSNANWTTIGNTATGTGPTAVYTVTDPTWTSVIVRLGVASTATGGSVWWDDISLKKVGNLDQGNVNLLQEIWNDLIQGLLRTPAAVNLTDTQAQRTAILDRMLEFRSEFNVENGLGEDLRTVLFKSPSAVNADGVPADAILTTTSDSTDPNILSDSEKLDELLARLDASVGTLIDEKSVDTNPGRSIAVNFSVLPNSATLPSTGSQTWSVNYLSGSSGFGVIGGKASWNTPSSNRVAKVIYRGTGTRTLVVSGTGNYTLTVGTTTTAAISSTAPATGTNSVQTLLTNALGTAGTGTIVTGSSAVGYTITLPQAVLGVMSVTPGTGVTAIISDPLDKTLTDYQLMKGTLADPPTLSGNTASAFTAMARVSDDGTSYVYAKAYWAGLGNLRGEIGYAINNAETPWQTNIPLTWSTELSFRVGVGDDPRTYQVYSGTKKVTEYTEQLVGGVYLSRMGETNRRFGAIVRQNGGNSSGTISSVSVTDSGASTVSASIARMTREDEQTFFPFPTANTPLGANFFENEAIKSDIIPDKVTGTFTVSKDGAYMVSARIKLSNNAETVGSVNLQVRANDGPQAGTWVTTQRGGSERPFDAGYLGNINDPESGFSLSGNWIQYLTAGSAVRLSTQRTNGSSSVLSGSAEQVDTVTGRVVVAGGSETYFTIAKL